MISGRDISNGVAAAVAMARAEDDWADRFDFSGEQVFRSFWAIPLALPAMLIVAEAQRRLAVENPVDAVAQTIAAIPPLTLYIMQTLIYLLVWAGEIVALTVLAQRRKAGWKISPLLIGANWSKFAFVLGSGLLTGAAVASGVVWIASIGGFLAYALLFWLRWGIVRRSMNTTPLATAGVLALLFLVFLAASMLVNLAAAVLGILELPEPQS